MNMGVCLGVCEIIEHDNLANNQSIMILYSILQGVPSSLLLTSLKVY